jgi:signal transduction histidine kinase
MAHSEHRPVLRGTDVAMLLRQAASQLAPAAAARMLVYVVDANERCLAAVDQNMLHRALASLLQSAFEAVPDRGTVRVTLRATVHDFTIAIHDSGPGVPPDLAVTRALVEPHEGRVAVSRSDPDGNCVQLTLPRRPSVMREPSSELAGAVATRHTSTNDVSALRNAGSSTVPK